MLDNEINKILYLCGVPLYEEKKGNGYYGYSKSNNAISAEEDNKFPASIAAKKLGVSADAIRKYIDTSEWHHYSKFYNAVDVYDITPYLMIKNKIDMTDDYTEEEIESFKETYNQMKIYTKEQKNKNNDVKTYRANVEYIEWAGTRNRPKAIKKSFENIKVEEKGKYYTFFLPDNTTVRKMIGSNGTHVISMEEVKKQQKELKEKEKQAKLYEIKYKKALVYFKKNTSLKAKKWLKSNDVEYNSGYSKIYVKNRKPTPWDYYNLSNFFKVGEIRGCAKYTDYITPYGIYLEEWNGQEWVSIESKDYNIDVPNEYATMCMNKLNNI